MNTHLKAAVDTLAFIAYMLIIGFGSFFLLDRYGAAGFYFIVGAFAIAGAYIVYGIALARRKYQETLKDSR